MTAEGHDRINVQNNPVNYIDPYGLQTGAPSVPGVPGFPPVLPPVFYPGTPENDAFVRDVNKILDFVVEQIQKPFLEAKGGKQNVRDTGLANIPDAEISRRARDKSLTPEERRRYQKEEKARKKRNKQKRCP